jgi:hypothetical protein
LEKFIAQHRDACVSMQAAAEHVTHQLPNEHSRVGCLLDAIQCNDAGMQAAMASIKTDQTVAGMRNNFEAAATHLLPCDPVQKKRVEQGSKRGSADISDVTGGDDAQVSSFGAKKGTGSSSGVPLRCHAKGEHDKLNKRQKDDLREWRKDQGGKDQKGKGPQKKAKTDHTKAIASAVEKQISEKFKSIEQTKTKDGEIEATVMSIVQKNFPKTKGVVISDVNADAATLAADPSPAVKQIVGRALNSKPGV